MAQNEVDALSRRSKSAEKAFFDVYKQLVDIADPTAILEQVPIPLSFISVEKVFFRTHC
jgi:hypothetical protein